MDARRLDVHHDQPAARRPLHGATANLAARLWQHRNGEGSAFCRRYHLTRLVLAEQHDRIEDAIAREKAMKAWKRAWKIALIEQANPQWIDLWDTIDG
jgi:putative endonuclease